MIVARHRLSKFPTRYLHEYLLIFPIRLILFDCLDFRLNKNSTVQKVNSTNSIPLIVFLQLFFRPEVTDPFGINETTPMTCEVRQ